MSSPTIPRALFSPKFYPHLLTDKSFNIFWGGRGSTKSEFVAQYFVLRSMRKEYMKLIYSRKDHTQIRESQFSMLKKWIRNFGLSAHFTCYEGSMKIVNKVTGNMMIAKGLYDPEDTKGVDEPSHLWMEELPEFDKVDFDTLTNSIRTGKTKPQMFGTMNPISEKNWTKSVFFDEEFFRPNNYKPNKNFGDDILLHHSTFRDNPFIDQDAYYKKLLITSAGNSNTLRINADGDWGKEEVGRPYCMNFSEQKHVSELAVFNPQLPVIFSLDFNVEPFVCLAGHIWTDAGGMHYHEFKELVIENNGDVDAMCDLIENTFGLRVVSNALFTGDAMQRKREITQRNNIDAWRMIDARFRLGNRLMVPRANPSVKENRHLINAIHAFHPDFKVHPSCKKLIYECQFVEANEEGDIVKKDRNKEAQRADALDAHRYKCNTFLHDFFERYRIK